MQTRASPIKNVTGVATAFIAAAALGLTFRDVDVPALGGALSGALPWIPVILLPQLWSLAAETYGRRQVFLLIGLRVDFSALLGIRIATEALGRTLPAGAVFCESVKPHLLGVRCGLSLSELLAGMAARKHLVLCAHAAYLAVALVVGHAALDRVAASSAAGYALKGIVVVAALGLLATALVWGLAFRHGSLVSRVGRLVAALPFPGREAQAQCFERFAAEADSTMVRTFTLPARKLVQPAFFCFLGWCFEAVETLFVLLALGVRLDLGTVLCIEVVVSLARNVLFIFPAGIGVQDTGYVTILALFGVPDPVTTGAAVAALKRGKEGFWAAVGYALLVAPRRVLPARSVGARGWSLALGLRPDSQ